MEKKEIDLIENYKEILLINSQLWDINNKVRYILNIFNNL